MTESDSHKETDPHNPKQGDDDLFCLKRNVVGGGAGVQHPNNRTNNCRGAFEPTSKVIATCVEEVDGQVADARRENTQRGTTSGRTTAKLGVVGQNSMTPFTPGTKEEQRRRDQAREDRHRESKRLGGLNCKILSMLLLLYMISGTAAARQGGGVEYRNATCLEFGTADAEGTLYFVGYGPYNSLRSKVFSPEDNVNFTVNGGECDISVPDECREEVYTALSRVQETESVVGNFTNGYVGSAHKAVTEAMGLKCKALYQQRRSHSRGNERKLAFTVSGDFYIDACDTGQYSVAIRQKCSSVATFSNYDISMYRSAGQRIVDSDWAFTCPDNGDHIQQKAWAKALPSGMFVETTCDDCSRFSRKANYPISWKKRVYRHTVNYIIPAGDTSSDGLVRHQNSLTRITETLLTNCNS